MHGISHYGCEGSICMSVVIHHYHEAQRTEQRGPRLIMFKVAGTRGEIEITLWTSWDILCEHK